LTYRIRRRRSRVSGGFVASAVAAGALVAVLSHHAAAPAAAGSVAAEAIAYARAHLGDPYRWGGTGPYAFDCSGLVQQAYASAGVSIARTSQGQWATERRVSSPQLGDLVFFAGADGTMTSPGHVGIVIGHGDMIEAYGTGVPIRVAPYDRPDLVGFTQPWGGAR
jgi:cell wall-associated NlpC family hydrolase